MHSDNYITLKLGNKIIFEHSLSQLNKLEKKNSKFLCKDIIPKIILDNNKKEKEFEQKIINERRLIQKMMNGFFSFEDKPDFIKEISKTENDINNLKQEIENNKEKDYNNFKEMISVLNLKEIDINNYKTLNNDKKNELLNLIHSNKKLYSNILGLNKNNIDAINGNYTLFKENIINENSNNSIIKRIGTEPNKNKYNNKNSIKEEYIEAFKNFVGNSKLSNRIISSYFDIEHPNVKLAAQKFFKSKYGLDEITLIYIYQKNPNNKLYHKFKLISEINEMFLAAKTENINNPKLYLKTGQEIKNNRKIKCIGALNLENNSIIKIL